MKSPSALRIAVGRSVYTIVLGLFTALVVGFMILQLQSGFAYDPGLMDQPAMPLGLGMLVMLIAIPVALISTWRDFTRDQSPARRGFVTGMTFGLWALSCAILVPYLGIYPVVWWTFAYAMVFGWERGGAPFWLTVYFCNLAVLPLAFAWLFSWISRPRHRLPVS